MSSTKLVVLYVEQSIHTPSYCSSIPPTLGKPARPRSSRTRLQHVPRRCCTHSVTRHHTRCVTAHSLPNGCSWRNSALITHLPTLYLIDTKHPHQPINHTHRRLLARSRYDASLRTQQSSHSCVSYASSATNVSSAHASCASHTESRHGKS
jgi:hypothetical protein